jgi:subfamily B ATP-binding cassette protein MsbA
MKSFFFILRYAKNQKKYAYYNVLFNLFFVLFGVFSLTLVMPVLKFLFLPENATLPSDVQGLSFEAVYHRFLQWLYTYSHESKTGVLWFVCLLLIGSTILKNISRYLALIHLKRLIHFSLRELKSRVFQKLLQLPISYFNREKKGDVMSRMSNDMKELEWSMVHSLEALFKEPFSILVFLGVLVYMSPLLTMFVLLLLPATAFLISIIGKKLKSTSALSQKKQGILLSYLEEILGGMKVVKSFVAEKQVTNTFEHINNDTTHLTLSVAKKVDLASPVSETLGILISAALLIIGGHMVFSDSIAPEVFIAYLILFSQLIPPFKQFSNAFYHVQKGIASAHRIEDILQAEETVTESIQAQPITSFEQEIQFHHISFKYDEADIIKNLNLTIKKGEKVALVGQSGSGKTTLSELLLRFYDVHQGMITIDGKDIRELSLKDLRQMIGLVSQDSVLFNDTAEQNIRLGKENATEEEMITALKQANAYDFIMEKKDGLKEKIGERGNMLSGGQKQRISIARALLKNPPILILDEATSALDTESEKYVQDALALLAKGRTILIIAHRLSTVKDADRIIVLHKGEIVESGDHKTLLQKNGYYTKLYHMQFHENEQR